MQFVEDNFGFVFFPFGNRITINEGNKTLVYLVAFEPTKAQASLISNTRIIQPGNFVSDDVIDSPNFNNTGVDFNFFKLKESYDKIYFPQIQSDGDERVLSMPMVSSICIGWNNDSFEFKNGIPWKATYRDLSEEGKKLYYSIKKLHNNKEVRILTFINI